MKDEAPETGELLVRKTLTVKTSIADAFAVFTEQVGRWWPLATHHIGAQAPVAAILEPRAGGRWFERDADGVECEWGRVLVWEQPRRLVLAWQINADWKPDQAIYAEVEVRFTPQGPHTTRVDLEHRRLDAFGERAAVMRERFDGGWSSILQSYTQHAESAGGAPRE
jgi:uncharacterized protein YndB with AHSA1/START domain